VIFIGSNWSAARAIASGRVAAATAPSDPTPACDKKVLRVVELSLIASLLLREHAYRRNSRRPAQAPFQAPKALRLRPTRRRRANFPAA
jgi:hypothetical protein